MQVVKDRAELRLGDGLSVLSAGEVGTIVLAGVSAQTTWEIIEKAPVGVRRWAGRGWSWCPATRHSELRRWLWQHGFALVADRPVQAAGRWYAVMAARVHRRGAHEPTFTECLLGGHRPAGRRVRAMPPGRRQSCPVCGWACRMGRSWQRRLNR